MLRISSVGAPRMRRAVALCLAYGLAVACWAFVARAVVPRVITAAYVGRSWAILNRILEGKSRPLGHYLDLWSSFSVAVALGVIVHLVLVFLIVDRPGTLGLKARLSLVIFAGGFLALTILSGSRHDYVAFLEIWAAVRRGGDPWSITPKFGYSLNAYGPLFSALAPLAWINPLAPKLLFATAYLVHMITFVSSRNASRRAAGWLLGPFMWVEVAYFGHFDVLVALSCVAAVRARLRDRDGGAGIALGMGVLLKYVPLALLPVLSASGGRVRWRLAASAGATVAVGMVVSLITWGPSVFGPLGFATSRGSSLASIFRFLRGAYSPLRLFIDAPNLDRYSPPILALGVVAVCYVCRRLRAAPDTAVVATILTTLLLYQVGFLQYQILVFLLLIDWLDRNQAMLSRRPFLKAAVDLYCGWLTVFNVVYAFVGGVLHPGDPLDWLDEVSGLVSFALGLVLLLLVLNVARDGPAIDSAGIGR